MPRSLLPREHGAYAQLAAPVIATCIAAPSLAGALLALAAACAFVANEPLLVVLGHRGKRMKAEDGARAMRWLVVLVVAALVAGITGLALAPHAIAAAALTIVPAVVLVGFAWQRKERTLLGELVAAITLTGAALPVAVAGGMALRSATWMWAAWAVGYALTVVAVHRVITRHKRRMQGADVSSFAAMLGAACGLAYLGLAIALPLAAAALALVIVAPSARHLRAIGFVLVGASLISLVVQQL